MYFKFLIYYVFYLRCAKWIEKCGLLIPLNVVLSKYFRICGKHFEENMFMNKKRNRLHPHAFPVLHLGKKYILYFIF